MRETKAELVRMEAEMDQKIAEVTARREEVMGSHAAYVDIDRMRTVPILSNSSLYLFRNPRGPLYVNYEVSVR
jgi:hypothetical protein